MMTLYHFGGPVACGRPAVAVTTRGNRYELAADSVFLLSGLRPQRGDAILCGSCLQPVVPQWLYTDAEMQTALINGGAR